MNTEKIEKLKKSLSNPKIPADLKPKIEAEIKRLEDLDAKQSEPKEEEKPVAKKTTTRKPRATKSTAKKTSTRKPSQTSKPKRTAMSVAKEIRKDGESWKDAMARASKMMKEKTHTATKDVESELDKLTKLIRGKKELKGQIGRTNLLIDAKRKAKPMGRRISKDGNVYYENRANRTDRGTFGKYHLAEGGYLTDPTFGNFQNQVFATGGAIKNQYEGRTPEDVWNNLTEKQRNHFIIDHKSEIKEYKKIQNFSSVERFKAFKSNWSDLDKDIKEVFTDHIDMGEYAKGGDIPNNYEGKTPEDVWNMWTEKQKEHFLYDHYKYDTSFEKYAYKDLPTRVKKLLNEHISMGQYAKGGGVRRVGNREYSLGRNWTNDHRHTNKGEDHEVKYTRKKRFELGGTIVTDLAGHTGGSLGGDPTMLDGVSGTSYTGLVGETGAMSSGEMFMAGGTLPDGVNQSYMITEAFGNPAQHYTKGGGVRKVGNREYSLGRNWTNDHRHTNKSEDHEVKYTRKGKFLGIFDGGGDTNNDSLPMSLKKRIDNLKGRVKISKKEAIKAFELHTEKGYGASSVGYELFDAKNKRDSQTFGDLAIDLGRYYSQYEDGGGVKGDRYDGKTEKIVEELKKLKGGLDNKAPKVYQRNGFIYVSAEEGDNYADYDNYLFIDEKLEDFADKYDTYWDWENAGAIVLMPLSDEDEYAKGGGVRRVGNREYSLGRNWTNDHRHVNKGEDHETGYTRKKSFAGGGGVGETPKIYVADLEAYNNGRLSGVWLDLADYNDADELMEAIQDFLNTTGGEEYAIHDAEYIPSSMYSEYMGQRDFEELYEMIDLAKDNNLPLSVVQEVVSQYDASAVEEFQGKYDSEEDFAEQMADEIGFENFSSPEYYVYITDTDRRLLAGEMADSYVDDIRDEDGGNRVIEEAGMDVSEYEEADSDRQEEMLDEAVEIVRDEYYDNWYEGLSDPYYFLVEEQGMYSPDDFFQASFISIDYEKLGRDLEQDYTFIYDDGELYVFNIR